jgi:hypothetical protein
MLNIASLRLMGFTSVSASGGAEGSGPFRSAVVEPPSQIVFVPVDCDTASRDEPGTVQQPNYTTQVNSIRVKKTENLTTAGFKAASIAVNA